MGTKIQPNGSSFLREYIDPNRSNNSNNGGGLISSLYHENQQTSLGSFSLWIPPRNAHFLHDFAYMRQMILEHESVFRNQLQELHRLYGRQKELMCDIRRRETEKLSSSSRFSRTSCGGDDVELSLRTMWRSDNSRTTDSHQTLDLFRNPERFFVPDDFFAGKLPCNDPPGRDAEPSLPHSGKRKLFGVEISDGNEEMNLLSRFDGGSSPSGVVRGLGAAEEEKRNEGMCLQKGISNWFRNPDQSTSENLPWFLKKKADDVNKEMMKISSSSYFMNLESLQTSTRSFFKKSSNGSTVGIDLNVSLDEADESLDPPPTADAPNKPSEPDSRDRLAAEAIMSISECSRGTADSNDAILMRFAELVCSEFDGGGGGGIDLFEFMTLRLEDSKDKQVPVYRPPIPDDDEKQKQTTATATARRCSRRGGGRSRKDFQRDILPSLVTLSRLEISEDLQAFEEVMKSCHGKGWRSGISSQRGGKKRLAAAPPSTPPSKVGRVVAISSSSSSQSPPRGGVCEQLQESSSLIGGWGKRTTRRLPRQRCPQNGFISSFPIKC
ncbi:hypothetical protein M569_09929 [Genlisea aurea]|uniref:Uncharacterized protein n=1 Tax=Genlisea aurea TaxID=192259 RepID=S8DPD3_9LAMI|nr:hypothetical protein M569_09929 [Genlisea aurea]